MPAFTGIDLDVETVLSLAEHPNIIGIKDSSGNVSRMGAILEQANSGFQVLTGSANVLLPTLSIGGIGGILALATIAPEQCLSIYRYFLSGDIKRAQRIQLRMISVNQAITYRWGIPALKMAMDFIGLYGGPVRAPLQPLSGRNRQELMEILQRGGIKKISRRGG
jgi:4-hydroxy-2-oxoglutarate aldolase